jgi:DNA-binding HxlR family transcriptional regulator
VAEISVEPIMALLDLLGRRWAMRVIWELRSEELTFRQLQQRCEGVSASGLNSRLHELREAELSPRVSVGISLRSRVGIY